MIIYLSLHCHHQNDFCIKVGSDESHFFLCFITGRDKVARQYRQFTTFEGKGEPKQIRTEVPLLTSLTARPNRLTVTVEKQAIRLYFGSYWPVWRSL